jgi:probable F420-dependent oxidoreductase
MRLDASLGFDPALGELPDLARRAESLGVAGLWSADVSHDPFLPLVVAAEHSDKLELGTAIAVAFARSPVAMAMTAWDLARLARGRFILGLGSQVRAHVERRFGMTWSGRPVAQLREYVAVVRAAWAAWQHGTRPAMRGEFYRFTLMTPAFSPGPIDHPAIPIYLAGVGAGMVRLAGEVADGLIVHPLHSRAYLADVVRPAVAAGAAAAGRPPESVVFSASVILATNESEVADARRTIGFYASTPTYRPVLEHHGWGDVADALAGHARHERWDEMAALVGDDMLDAFAVVCSPGEARAALERRAVGLIDRVAPYAAFGTGAWAALSP